MEISNFQKPRRRPNVLKGKKKSAVNAVAVSKAYGNSAMKFSPAKKTRALVLPRREFSADDFLKNLNGRFGIAQKKFFHALSFFWLLPVLSLALSSPFLIFGFVSAEKSFAKKIDFNFDMENEFSVLDDSMSKLAFDNFSYFDSEGNIFSEDGTQFLSGANPVKQAVTFQTYTVKAGDTISGICQKFGLSNISTLIAVNDIKNVRAVFSGQKLKIPSADGLIHKIKSGETLDAISKKYNVSVSDLLDVNDLASENLQDGETLFIPGAKLDSNSLRKAMGELFLKPVKTRYVLSSRFGHRKDPITGVDSSHTGIDMACPTGTPIYASLSGRVAYTGFSSIFGNYVIINHFDGYQTLYAHMSKIIAKKGDFVTQETKIGLVGSTGYSTGPHVHFTVYKNNKLIDPMTVLK